MSRVRVTGVAGLRSAVWIWPSVTKPASTMLCSTSAARARAAGRLTCGAYLVGALNRPASMAASARLMSLSGFPK